MSSEEAFNSSLFTRRVVEGDNPAGEIVQAPTECSDNILEMQSNICVSIPQKPGFLSVKIHDPRNSLPADERMYYIKKPGIRAFTQRLWPIQK